MRKALGSNPSVSTLKKKCRFALQPEVDRDSGVRWRHFMGRNEVVGEVQEGDQ